jgi:epoxide hydrolase-like predicted phosphatase
MIKAIIFDYFGVITSDNFWQFTGEDINAAGNFHQLIAKVNTGALSWQAFIVDVAQELHQTPQAVMAMYKNERIDLELLGYIKQLRNRYKTALLTNSSYEYLEPVIANMKLDRFFDEIVISSRLGMIKPNPDIFNYTLIRLKVDSHEAIFIDDRLSNVAAARQLGIKSILYDSMAQLQKELKHLT